MDVVFRRVRGRIIPIKVNDGTPAERKRREKQITDGAKYTVAGAATATVTGRAYKEIVSRSTRASARAFKAKERMGMKMLLGNEQFSFRHYKNKAKVDLLTSKALSRAAKVSSVAPNLRKLGLFSGSTLIGAGASSLAEGFTRRDLSELESAAIGTTAASGAFVVGVHGKKGVKSVLHGSLPTLKNLAKAKFKIP